MNQSRCHICGLTFVIAMTQRNRGRRLVDEEKVLAERFEAHRRHLRGVAYRMLGSPTEADDAVQEAWLRLSRSDTTGVNNLAGWLTTVVSRVCLDMLRARKSRGEETLHANAQQQLAEAASDPAQQML